MSRWRTWASLLLLTAAVALNNVDRGLFALLLADIRKSIPLSDSMTGILLGPAFMVVYSLAGLPIAWLADRWNRGRIISLGLVFWSLVTAMTGVAARPLHLLLLRGALGLGEASNVAPTTAVIRGMFPARQRALAFTVLSVGTPAGILFAYPLVGHISATQGWRQAFFLMGTVGVAVAAAIMWVVRAPAGEAGQPAPRTASRGGLPAELMRTLSQRPFRRLVFAAAFFSFVYASMAAWVPSFLGRAHGLSVEQVGATLGLYRGGAGILAALGGGALVTALIRRDERWLAWVPAGLCALLVPAELLLLFAPERQLWQLGLALDTIFLTAAIPCTFALLAQLADARAPALSSAAYFLVFNLVGQSLGPYAVGALSQALSALAPADALRDALLIVPASALIASLLFWRLGNSVRPKGTV